MFSVTWSWLVDAVFPPRCIHCQREGAWLCPAGRDELRGIAPRLDPLPIPGVDRVICRGSYDSPILQALITGVKYQYWTAYRAILPDVLTPLRSFLPAAEISIIPIPLHSRRHRWRGFNQSEIIAAALAQTTTAPVEPVLVRHRSTQAQARLSAGGRETNIIGAFALRPGVEKVPPCGILVDDVITTGSTIRECASVLRKAGMKHIVALALAKG